MGPGAVRRDDAGRAPRHRRGGIPPDGRPRRPGGELGAPAEGAHARQALLHVLRARRHPRTPSRPQGVGRPLRRSVRRRLGRAAGADLRPPEGIGCDPGRRRAHGSPRRDPGLGRHARRPQAGAGPGDGGLRRVPRAHRPPRRPCDRRHRGPRRPRRHHRLLHHRRQRRVRRRHPEWCVQRDGQLQRDGCARDPGVHGFQDGRVRVAVVVQPLRGRVGVGDERPVPVDQAGRVALGWHPQRHHRALARRHRGAGRAALTVHPCHRCRAHHPGCGRAARADHGQRRAAVAHGGHEHALHVQPGRRPGAARPPVLRDVRQPRHLPPGLERGHQAPHPLGHDGRRRSGLRRRRLGALRRQHRLQPGPRPRDPTTRPIGAAPTAVAHRGHEVQRPPDRRPRCRTVRSWDGGAAHPHPRQLTAVLPRYGAPVGEQRGEHQEQVVLGHR